MILDLVAGTRPNFIKIAPILRALQRVPVLSARLVHTGQHYDRDMSDVFFQDLGIRPPDVHLGAGSGSQASQTARILTAFEEHLLSAAPKSSGVLVVGDVNSTLACSLAAAKLMIRVAHVEAGLRSFDRSMPEEINRVITDALADLLFVSEPAGLENLRREGVSDSRVRYVGNVMIDSLVHELPHARAAGAPARLGLTPRSYGLVTLHRPSNVDDPARLATILAILKQVAARLALAFPVHPRTKQRLMAAGLMADAEQARGLMLLDPLGYRDNLGLMADATLVITDSGGIQEETTFLDVPCLTIRPNTERPITITRGTSTLVGNELSAIPAIVDEITAGRAKHAQAIDGWDGRAAERIVEALTKAWC